MPDSHPERTGNKGIMPIGPPTAGDKADKQTGRQQIQIIVRFHTSIHPSINQSIHPLQPGADGSGDGEAAEDDGEVPFGIPIGICVPNACGGTKQGRDYIQCKFSSL